MEKALDRLENDIRTLNDFDNAPLDLILHWANVGIQSLPKKLKTDLKTLEYYPRRGRGPFYGYDGKKVFIKESSTKRPRFFGLNLALREEDIRKYVKRNYHVKLPNDFDCFKLINLVEDIRENLIGEIRWLKSSPNPSTLVWDNKPLGDWLKISRYSFVPLPSGSKEVIKANKAKKREISNSRFKNLKVCICGKFFLDERNVGRPKKYCSNECKNSPPVWVAWTRAHRENMKYPEEVKVRKEKEKLLKKFKDEILPKHTPEYIKKRHNL